MASRRIFKKEAVETIDELIGLCLDSMEQGANEEKAEALLDEVADLYEEVATRIRQSKSKADFNALKADLTAKSVDYAKKINAL